jgi:DNA repair protein RecO (recombination protein O)
MAKPRTYKTEAVVVRQSPLGEADRIITMLSPERGQIRAVAKGVRKSTGRLTGHLELLNRVEISVAEGRNLDVVTEAQCLDGFPALRDDLERVSAGMFLAELVDGFAMPEGHGPPDAQGQEMYRLLVQTLDRLNRGQPVERLLPYFQVRVLALSGLSPELTVCVQCGRTLEQRRHAYSAGGGGIACPDCVSDAPGPFLSVSVGAIKLLRFYQSRGLDEAVELDAPPGVLEEANRLLDAHLRHHLDREIRSSRFLKTLDREQAGG